MLKNLEEISAATMQLDLEDRARLAGKLLLSLDEPSSAELERLWLDEAERRLEDFRSGKVQGIPAENVFRRSISEMNMRQREGLTASHTVLYPARTWNPC